ncbi:MAG TPA: hypothetical protein VMF30_09040 [Pirellulales bacterium]|nr:hypothetical protein [Pirellulales bacterium]
MSERKPRRASRAARPASKPREAQSAESRLAETATVAWMLATLVTLCAELAVAAIALWRWLQPDSPLPPLFAGVFWLCAGVVGAVSLVLAAVVLRSRRVPPPRGVTVVALVAGALPLMLAACGWFG